MVFPFFFFFWEIGFGWFGISVIEEGLIDRLPFPGGALFKQGERKILHAV